MTPDLMAYPWLEVHNLSARLGRVRHALFDFDGTISVIRQGWEKVMIPLMLEMICGAQPITPAIEAEVASYVDDSTGILTIRQMEWLAEAVQRYGYARYPKTASAYKKIYNERLLIPVRERLSRMDNGLSARAELMIAGALPFLQGLRARGVTLYLASGTDHIYVQEEAAALGLSELFGGHIYGAQDDNPAVTKEGIMQRILDDEQLQGEELLVVGDGPVEIRHARRVNAVSLGVAADERYRMGLDPHKRQRLLKAGADLIVTDLLHHADLVKILTEE
jgi:phosphoglycolate phosphatase-like HAD superfamily hydrolase